MNESVVEGDCSVNSQDFTARMRTLTDEELGEVVAFGERDGFLPSAIEAARQEFAARNLTPTSISTVAASIKTKREDESARASRPLSWPARIAFLIFSLGLFPVFFAMYLGSNGYKQKSSDAWKWMGLGVAFWVGLVVLLVLLTVK
jgi:hypothetical protein